MIVSVPLHLAVMWLGHNGCTIGTLTPHPLDGWTSLYRCQSRRSDVPFTHKLAMGDQVEIILKRTNPSRDWLNPTRRSFVHSSRARANGNGSVLRVVKKNLEAGRNILEVELGRVGATLKDAEQYALKNDSTSTLQMVIVCGYWWRRFAYQPSR